MSLPFSADQFFAVFVAYNEAVWPVQIVLVGLAFALLALLRRPGSLADRSIAAGLTVLWLWVGVVYHLVFFTSINPLAYVFSAMSVLGAAAFAWEGVVHGRLRFSLQLRSRWIAGLLFVAYALIVYPLLCMVTGHSYPAMPTFGLPCPTTLFTVGLLLCAERPVPRTVLVVPVLWSFIGLQGGILLGVPADFALAAAAVAGVWLMGFRRPHALQPARV